MYVALNKNNFKYSFRVKKTLLGIMGIQSLRINN